MSSIKVNSIVENTADNGVTVDGVLLKDGGINIDSLSEKTSGSGVTIDGALIKDGQIAATAGGAFVKLASATASASADLTFDNFADKDTYAGYKIFFNYIKAATDNVELRFTFRNSTPSDITGSYVGSSAYAFMSTTGSSVNPNQSTTNYGQMTPGIGNQDAETLSFQADLFLPNGTNGIASISFPYVLKEYTNNVQSYYTFTRALDTQTEVKGLKFYLSSGNITSGDITIFGIKK